MLFNTETSGAVGPRGIRLLGQLAKDVQRKGAVDGNFYGTSRASTRSFFPHHLGAIASSIVRADALTALQRGGDAGLRRRAPVWAPHGRRVSARPHSSSTHPGRAPDDRS